MATTSTDQPSTASAAPEESIARPRTRLRTRRRVDLDVWTALHWAGLLVAGGLILYLGRNHWYDVDEWTFIVYRSEDPSIGLFTPLNEHWMTIPVLVYRALFLTVGFDSYLPFLGVVVVLHLFLTHLLWRTSLRAGADPAIATAVAAVFSVLGAGGENLTLAIQMGFVGALAFGWLALLCHDHPGPFDRRDVAGWAAATVALMCSGPALAMVGVATLCAALRRRRPLDVALVMAVPAAVYGTWYLLVGRHYSATTMADLTGLVEFVWHGVINVVNQAVGIPDSGVVLVLALLWWWMRHPEDTSGPAAVAAATFAGVFAWFVLTGSGRAAYGTIYAELSRYVYIGAALLVPTAALVLSRATPNAPITRIVVVGLCAAAALHNFQLLRERSAEEVGREQALKRQIVAAADLLRDDPTLAEHPGGIATGDDLLAPLIYPERLRLLMDAGWTLGGEGSPHERLTAELMWQVGIEAPAEDLGTLPQTATTTGVGVVVERTWPDGYATVRGAQANTQIVLQPGDSTDGDGVRVRLRAAQPTRLRVQLVEGLQASDPRDFVVDSRTKDLVSDAAGRTLVVTLPADQPILICGTDLR